MGLLDEIMKSLEEAQRDAERRRAPAPRRPVAMPAPERSTAASDDEAADEAADEAEDIAVRRQVVVRPAPAAQSAPVAAARRTVASSAPAEARHVLHGPQAGDRIRTILRNPRMLRDALVAREILGPPPGLRRLRRR